MSHPPPAEQRLFTENPDDETLEVWMDGEVLMTFTYDDIGFSGMRAVTTLIEKIAAEL